MAEEYTLLDTQFPVENIKREVINGRLYVDGVPVKKWQLTPDELKEYFPDDHIQEYGIGPIPCPLPSTEPGEEYKECGQYFDGNNRGYFMNHARQRHKEWYEKNQELMQKQGSTVNIFKAIKAGQDVK